MANKTINELSPVTLSSTSEFAVYQNGSTGKATLQNVTNAAADKSINKLGIKNLIPYPYRSTSKIVNGVTFTDNGDGTITVNGTATANCTFVLQGWTIANGAIPLDTNLRYTLSGCPEGGTTSTYALSARVYTINETPGASTGIIARDTGNEITFNSAYAYISPYIAIFSGATVSNLTFKPMLRVSTDTDSTWMPYVATNATLTKQLNNNFLYADDEEEPTGEVEFESADTTLTPSSSTSVDLLTGNDSWGQRFAKISQMFKNIRYLFSKVNTIESTVNNRIGTVTEISLQNNFNLESNGTTASTLIETTFPGPGRYIVIAKVTFPTNSTGTRACGYGVGTTTSLTVQKTTTTRATDSGSTILQAVSFSPVTINNYPVRLLARQTSGSTLSIQYASLMIIRVG